MLPAFDWNFTGAKKAKHEKVATAVAAEDYAAGLVRLDEFCKEFGIDSGVPSCFKLADTDKQKFTAFSRFVIAAPEGNWARFCIKLTAAGYVPPGELGAADEHFDAARHMIVRSRWQKSPYTNAHWRRKEFVARTAPFYPERIRRHANRRDRICAIAKIHQDLGPQHLKQYVLFSLGGLYDLNTAYIGANRRLPFEKDPIKAPGTTCFLFARSVLHAAGCNVITEKTNSYQCGCQSMQELPKSIMEKAWVPMGHPDNVKPAPGDIYLIQGAAAGSSHVGVITEVQDSRNWVSIEGGGAYHVNSRSRKNLINTDPATKGRWAFANDTATKAGRRPILGWISIDKIPGENWMIGA